MPISATSSGRCKFICASWALGALLLLSALFSLCTGASGLSLMEAFREPSSPAALILWHVRLPRTVAAMLSGAALAASGAVIQGVLHNPLAGPNIIGVNAGAGFAALLISWLWPGLANWLPAAAFAGALGASLIILLLVQRTRASRLTVVLAGVAISAILSAGSDLITTLAPEVSLGMTAFRVGGFSGVSAGRVYGAACYILPGLSLALYLAHDLDVLALGDDVAQSVGLRVKGTRLMLLCLSSLLAGAAVSFSGLIGFLGLIVPHLVRRLAGGEYRLILPLSMLGGALLMLLCDTAARTLFAPYELPVGILLSLIGGPFFLFLLLRQRKGGKR